MISKAYEEAYGELMEFVQGNTLETVGAPIGIEVKDSPEQYVFRAALAIVATEATPTGQIQRGESYAGDALKATHLGAYDKMGETVDKLRAYAAVHKLKVSAQPIYVFVDDPTNVAPEAVKTEVLLPVAQ